LFFEELRSGTAAVAAQASLVGDMLGDVNSVDRIGLDTLAAGVGESIAELRAIAGQAPEEEPSLVGPMVILDEAMLAWEAGTTSLHDLMLQAADGEAAAFVEDEIAAALVDLRSGDRLYAAFVRVVADSDLPPPVAPFPQVSFIPDGYPITVGPGVIVDAATSPDSPLELRAQIAIDQVATVPELIVSTNNEQVVTVTESLTVRVVVRNDGNTGSEPIEVLLTLTAEDGTTVDQTRSVESVDAAAQTTVEFPDLVVVPGWLYELRIRLPIAEAEEESHDNLRTITFRVNEETPDETTADEGEG
jgi:hypothetical protein